MWSVKEELGLGKGYVYCSKNVTGDTLASNYFGKASTWQSDASGTVYSIGDVRTDTTSTHGGTNYKQYICILGHTKTTAPSSDLVNWVFDTTNHQTYLSSVTYSVGSKTVSSLLHYVCLYSGTTGAFNSAKWTQVPISNKTCPFRYMNTAIGLINGDTRFVSYEYLNYSNNKASHNIYLLISNGTWNETLTSLTKYVRFVGQSKWKTKLISTTLATTTYYFCDTINFDSLCANTHYYKISNCVFVNTGLPYTSGQAYTYWTFAYKNIFTTYQYTGGGAAYQGTYVYYYHMVKNTFYSKFGYNWFCDNATNFNYFSTFYPTSIVKNNYFNTYCYFGTITNTNVTVFDYNYFVGRLYTTYNTYYTSLSTIQSAISNQNLNSFYSASGVTLNSDFTLSTGSTLVGIGQFGETIGAEGVGVLKDTTNIFGSSEATYRNIKTLGLNLVRDQIGKVTVSATINTIVLESAASSVNNEYTGFRITITQGTGLGETKTITNYVGLTKTATVDTNWVNTPDNTSVYEILDGEVESGIVNLGVNKIISKINFNTLNDSGENNLIGANVSSTNAIYDVNQFLTYELKYGFLSDLSDGAYKMFNQDEELKVDATGRGCGDPLYNQNTLICNALVMRYYRIKIGFHK